MGLTDRITARHREMRRADPVSLEEFGALLGRSSGFVTSRPGITITEDRALGITAWYSGVRYLAESAAYLPVKTFRNTGGLSNRRREPRADPLWLQRPDVELPSEGLWEFAMYSMLHRGNFCALKLRDDVGRVTGLRPIHPDNITKWGVASDGAKVFEVKDKEGGRIPLTTREVLHIPGVSKDGQFGISPIRAHAESLGIVAAADESAGQHFSNVSHPIGIISVPQDLDDDEADELKTRWERFHRGLKNRDEIGVLSNGASYDPIVLNARDAQMLEARQYGVTEIARMLRIPPHKLYDLTRATFSNIEHQSIEAVMDSIRPWCERIEAWTNFDRDLVVPGTFIEFQLEGLLRGDTITRYRSYQMATGGHPWMKPSEPRELENLPPVEGLDFVPEPLNMGKGGTPPGGGDKDREERMEQIDERVERLERVVTLLER